MSGFGDSTDVWTQRKGDDNDGDDLIFVCRFFVCSHSAEAYFYLRTHYPPSYLFVFSTG